MPSVAELRADLVPFVLAVLLLATGLGALALALLRREALLVSYAVFVGLYGLRLAAGTSWASGVLGFDPRSTRTWAGWAGPTSRTSRSSASWAFWPHWAT